MHAESMLYDGFVNTRRWLLTCGSAFRRIAGNVAEQRCYGALRWCLLALCGAFYMWIAGKIGLGATDGGPDEMMRSLIPRCMINGNWLPSGYDSCAIYGIGNWSYAFYPQFIAAYLSAFFMSIAKMLGMSASMIFMWGRGASIVFGLVTLFCVSETVSVVFRGARNRGLMVCLAVALMGAWPQFAFLSSYMNNDIAAMCGVTLLVYAMVSGVKDGWRLRNALVLSLGVIVAGLGYWNAYGFVLVAICVFIATALLQNRDDMVKGVRLIAVAAGVCAVVVLPFFAVNVVRYGDLIGMSTFHERYVEWLAAGGEVLQHPWRDTVDELFFESNFVQDTVQSFIGDLGYMAVTMPYAKYLLYITWTLIGTGLFLSVVPRYARNVKFLTVAIAVLAASAITLCLYMYYNLNTDYQPQGRYIIYLLVPLVIGIVAGIGKVYEFRGMIPKIVLLLAVIWYVSVGVDFFVTTVNEQGWEGVLWTGLI